MAIIGKIRKRSGLIIIIIGIALAAFVLGDFLKPGKRGKQVNYVGEVAGENIPYVDFAQKVDEQIENTKQRDKKDKLTSDEVFNVRQQTWNQMVRDLVLGKQYDNLGVAVSTDELFDLVQGKNPHQYILQYFQDPNTKQYNPQLVVNFLKQLDQVEPAQKKNWLMLEKAIKEDRLNTKYNNLLGKAYYMPKAFLQRDYVEKNRRYNVRMVAAPYQTVDDKTITLTDADYQKYYDENKNQYDQEASRDMDYVLFELLPSETDRKQIAEDVAKIYQEFSQSTDVPNYVNANSDTKYDSTWKKAHVLLPRIDSAMFNSAVGTFIPPFIENNKYSMAKLLDVQMRPDSMKASHILISFAGSAVGDQKITRTKEKAQKMADSLMVILKKNAAQFPAIAASLSDDNSNKAKGGDLGWFTDGSMVSPFNEACVKGNVGEIKLVETVFGFHLIQIADKKAAVKKVKVAILDRRIEPSGKTIQDIYAKASEFAGDNTTLEAFEKTCQAKALNKRVADYLHAMDNSLPGLAGARNVVQWAFNDETKKESVSSVFEIEGSYVVAAVRELRDKGIPPLDQLKKQIEPLVRRDKKSEKLIEKMKQSGTTDLYQLATKITSKVDTIADVVFFSGNLPKFGPEPEVLGTISNMKLKGISAPVKGNNAVYVVMLDSIKEAPETKDYTMFQRQVSFGFTNRVAGQAYQTLEKMAKLVDNRVKFY
ncbi:MAG: SurA N-terminal domain-containing protein [Bacteroidota bacterium]